LSTSGHLRMSSEVALGRQCPRASFSNLRIWPGCSHSTRPGGHGAQTAAPESRLRSKVPTSQLCNSRGRRTHAVRACVMLGRCLVAGAAETTAQSEFESGRSPAFVNGPCALNSYHTERFDGRGSRWALKTADRSERARVWIVSIERAIAPYSTAAPRPWLAADTRVRRRQVLGKRVPPSRTNAGLCAAELAVVARWTRKGMHCPDGRANVTGRAPASGDQTHKARRGRTRGTCGLGFYITGGIRSGASSA
jgi:hypothetical protein